LHWRSPESGELWYTLRQFKKIICSASAKVLNPAPAATPLPIPDQIALFTSWICTVVRRNPVFVIQNKAFEKDDLQHLQEH